MYDDININYEVSGIQKSSVILFSMEKQWFFLIKIIKSLQSFYFLFVIDIFSIYGFLLIYLMTFFKKNVSFLKIYTN